MVKVKKNEVNVKLTVVSFELTRAINETPLQLYQKYLNMLNILDNYIDLDNPNTEKKT